MRAEGERRTKLHFVVLEFTGDCEADVYAALADLKVPEGCKMMSVDEDLFYSITDAVGISCIKKARLVRLVSTMLHVANVIKDRAANLIKKQVSLSEESQGNAIRWLARYKIILCDGDGPVYSVPVGNLSEFLRNQCGTSNATQEAAQ